MVAKRAHSQAAAVAGAVVALPPEDQAVAEEVGSRVVAAVVAVAVAGAARWSRCRYSADRRRTS